MRDAARVHDREVLGQGLLEIGRDVEVVGLEVVAAVLRRKEAEEGLCAMFATSARVPSFARQPTLPEQELGDVGRVVCLGIDRLRLGLRIAVSNRQLTSTS